MLCCGSFFVVVILYGAPVVSCAVFLDPDFEELCVQVVLVMVLLYFGGVRLDLGFEDAVWVVSYDGGGVVAYFGGVRLGLGFEHAVFVVMVVLLYILVVSVWILVLRMLCVGAVTLGDVTCCPLPAGATAGLTSSRW